MTDHTVGGYHVSSAEAGTARAQEVERQMAADRAAQRQADADASRRASEEADRSHRAQAAANARDRQRAEAARAKQARSQSTRPSKAAPRSSPSQASSSSAEPGSMAGFFGFSGAVASALYAGTRAWREQSVVELASRSDAPFMEAVKGAIEVGGPEIWIPTVIAAVVGGSLLYHLYKPLLVLVGLGAAAFVFAHGKKEGWF